MSWKKPTVDFPESVQGRGLHDVQNRDYLEKIKIILEPSKTATYVLVDTRL